MKTTETGARWQLVKIPPAALILTAPPAGARWQFNWSPACPVPATPPRKGPKPV